MTRVLPAVLFAAMLIPPPVPPDVVRAYADQFIPGVIAAALAAYESTKIDNAQGLTR